MHKFARSGEVDFLPYIRVLRSTQMKCLSIMMVSFLIVAIAMVSSNETGPNEPSLNRLARAANGGKGKKQASTQQAVITPIRHEHTQTSA
ncbi:hypothetical protein ACI65C_007723 [Semiaphis heraclei]